ncbi:MAG: stage 0 sporulation family protein [Clostridiales bacterium]|nr:stage 0 sporulation family protein [Clostridiales bacterium]
MPKVVSIRFHDAGKSYHFDPGDLRLHMGDAVMVETSEGLDLGYVSEEAVDIPEDQIIHPLRTVLRKVTEQDQMKYEARRDREQEAFEICLQKIEARGLKMNLVNAEYSSDDKKIIFFFTADGRVDFRELVKDLAAVFRIRIELRQIGARDQARMIGGLGMCGRELCCCSFLDGFIPVSIKMAKEQGLSMNPSKISGACGRLMCCLKFEQGAYEDAHARLPRQGDIVMTPKGRGTVMSVDILRERVAVRPENDDDADYEQFEAEEVEILFRKGKRFCPRDPEADRKNHPHRQNDLDESSEEENLVAEEDESQGSDEDEE